MTLPNGAHVQLGGIFLNLDESYDYLTKKCYDHYGRSLFSGTNVITGKPGSQNLNPDTLFWHLTDFDGEGQVVLDANDDASARHFYRSEGLNFRTPGEFALNPSSAAQSPLDSSGGASSTKQGNADFSDVVGTSTASGTDRQLNVVADKVKSSNYAPGAGSVQAQFFAYLEATTVTSIIGSSLQLDRGSGKASGVYFNLNGGTAQTVSQTTLPLKAIVVNWYAHTDSTKTTTARVSIIDTTGNNEQTVYTSGPVSVTGTTIAKVGSTTFTPKSGHTYRFKINGGGNITLHVDRIDWHLDTGSNTATVEIYNETGAVTVKSQTVTVTSTAAGTQVAALVFTAAAATNYSFRVTRTSGPLKIWVDKAVGTVQSTATWILDLAELGQGGSIWLVGHRAAVDSQVWRYNTSTNSWDNTGNPLAGATAESCYAMAHTDKYEYFLMSDRKIYRSNGGAGAGNTEAYTGAITGTQVGMAIAQDRIFTLSEDATNGVVVHTFPVDQAAATAAELSSTVVTSALNTADTNLRQRMCATPTGARFFVNYSDVTCKIYEADASGASLVYKELDELGHGVKATAISYEGGITFIVGQYVAESDQTPRSALWIIDANGVLQRIGYFRRDDPNSNVPVSITPYQSDLFVLQGPYVWRYSLTAGGLFLEYQLQPTTASNQRSLSVLQSRTIAVYSDEVWATGSVAAYRQSGTAGANQFVSSVYDFGIPGVTKMLTNVSVLCDTLAANTSVQLEVQLDQSGTWTTLGTMTSGALGSFQGSDETSQLTGQTIQVRVTPATQDGLATPHVRAVIVQALPTKHEEFFDLVLLTTDEDSNTNIPQQQMTGNQKAQVLRDLWQRGVPTTFVDGYEDEQTGVAPTYLVRIENFQDMRASQGEGHFIASLRVLSG